MNKYEELLQEANNDHISVDENFPFIGKTSGLYIDGNIALSDRIETTVKKTCILAEELGHYHTTVGNIIDQTNIENVKQERQARLWAYNKLVGLGGILSAYKANCRTAYEIAEHLDVTEEFLQEALFCYRQKYGEYKKFDNYVIYFEPSLGVFEII